MSKQREGLPDLMDQALGAGSSRAAGAGVGEMKTYSMRLPISVMEKLRAHFAAHGLSLSAGVRLWLIERMKQEGL